MIERTIEEIVDSYLEKWKAIGLNKLPRPIDKEMAGPTDNEGWTTWYAIDSQVTDAEIRDFEEQIGHKFPADYKRFLKHKHFYELNISEATFTHPVNTWRRAHVGLIYEGYPREFLIDKGYLPIAGWSDWGVLCFDTNSGNREHNYPVVLWDHEMAHTVTPAYNSFTDLMRGLDSKAYQREFDTK
jgi:hypothetical protein